MAASQTKEERFVKKWLLWMMVPLFAWAAGAPAAESSPDALVKTQIEEVLGVIKQNRDKRTLQDLAEKKVLPHFDFAAMTQLAVGRAWRDATPEQRQALEQSFRSLIVSTYTTALSQTMGTVPVVDVKPAQVEAGGKDATVRTVVKQPGKQPFNIDYRMSNNSGGWKVNDVVVENLSLVTNYRSSFASEISRSGVDGLIKTLQEKNRQIAQG
jgi:phospholipid transport system substrate-binding protein